MDGSFTSEEKNQCGIDATNSYKVTTESTISGSGKRLPVPVSSEGRQFEGWFTKDGHNQNLDGNHPRYDHKPLYMDFQFHFVQISRHSDQIQK